MMLKPESFFDLSEPHVDALFSGCTFVWEAITKIAEHVSRMTKDTQIVLGEIMPGAFVNNRKIYIAKGARIEPGAYVQGPAYIGEDVVIRHGAYVRENVISLKGSILGHASEAKNAIFLPSAYAPHFNYIGDSILGHRVNLGAGTKLSNLGILSKKDKVTGKRPSIKITIDGQTYDTGIVKMGAIIGDGVQTGCNAVLNPGCLVGSHTLIYANLSLRKGFYPPDSIVKLRQKIEITEKLDI